VQASDGQIYLFLASDGIMIGGVGALGKIIKDITLELFWKPQNMSIKSLRRNMAENCLFALF
jgi:hypothetical protein